MELRELRKNNNITQLKAAQLLNMPLRTYIRYENEEKYKDSEKYRKYCNSLYDCLKIDEDHGTLTIQEIKKGVEVVFDKYNIEFAFLFGSYARGNQNEKSDIDIVVSTDITGMEYCGIIEELRETLNKKIDLIRLKDIKSSSDFLKEVLRVAIKIYDSKK